MTRKAIHKSAFTNQTKVGSTVFGILPPQYYECGQCSQRPEGVYFVIELRSGKVILVFLKVQCRTGEEAGVEIHVSCVVSGRSEAERTQSIQGSKEVT